MNLIIAGKLLRPPSSITCVRDVTLYATVFGGFDVLLACRPFNKDRYWKQLKTTGAFDYIKDIVNHGEEYGSIISPHRPCSLEIKYITAGNLHRIVQYINMFQ